MNEISLKVEIGAKQRAQDKTARNPVKIAPAEKLPRKPRWFESGTHWWAGPGTERLTARAQPSHGL